MVKYTVVPQKTLTDVQRKKLGAKFLAFSYRKGDTVYFCVCGLNRTELTEWLANANI